MDKDKRYGITIALIAAILWGFSGNIAEYIFSNSSLQSMVYVQFRMLFTGIILLIYGVYLNGTRILIKILTDKRTIMKLAAYTVFGVALLQASFAETVLYSNAAFATLIQFLAPLIIIIYLSIKFKKLPTKTEVICTLVALIGMFYMITGGHINTLKVSPSAILAGLISAVSFVFYILYVEKLFKFPTTMIVGSAMAFGSFLIIPFADYTTIVPNLKWDIIAAFVFNVVLGNVLPFYLFLESTRYIKPRTAALISAFEPLTALVIGIIFLNNRFELTQIFGSVLIVASVTFISIFEDREKDKEIA